jgi:hypothetical protein
LILLQIIATMDLSTQLFENAPVGIDGVLGQICQIFVTHWKPLVMITGLQLVAFIGASIVLGGFTFAFISAFAVLGGFDFLVSAKYSVAIIAIVQIMSNNTRHLLDYSVGISGASRFLSASRFLDEDYYADLSESEAKYYADLSESEAKFIAAMIALIVLWVVVLSLVSSIFAGAFYHALAEIYTGIAPSPNKSIRHGLDKMWNVYFFQLLISLLIGLSLFVTLVATIGFLLAWKPAAFLETIILGFVLYITFMVLLSTVMVAAIPAIVVEGKSAVQAFHRSLNLCKSFICFIYCSQICYALVLIISMVLINLILDQLPAILGLIGHLALQIVTTTIAPM